MRKTIHSDINVGSGRSCRCPQAGLGSPIVLRAQGPNIVAQTPRLGLTDPIRRPRPAEGLNAALFSGCFGNGSAELGD